MTGWGRNRNIFLSGARHYAGLDPECRHCLGPQGFTEEIPPAKKERERREWTSVMSHKYGNLKYRDFSHEIQGESHRSLTVAVLIRGDQDEALH